jgi:hypothetical protein
LSPVNSRKIPIICGLIGMAIATYIAAEAQNYVVAVAAVSVAVFCNGGASGMSWPLAGVAAPANCTASLGSMMNFGGYVGGALAPTVTGTLSKRRVVSNARCSPARRPRCSGLCLT